MRNILFPILFFLPAAIDAQSVSHDLHFNQLANRWDEAIPLGNATVGALIWKKQGRLRFSLDRADIWDMRPMKGLHRKEFSYEWVQERVRKNDYKIVQQYFDVPYDKEPAPSKIPAGAIEFNVRDTSVVSVHLSLQDAVCEVRWKNGMVLKTLVHAIEPVGWFRFENISGLLTPQLVAPEYEGKLTGGETNSLVGDDLARLGYKQGKIEQQDNRITYLQEGWGGFTY
jgi:alpha-L-fucosidase 2